MKRKVHDTVVLYYWFDHLLLRHNGDAEKVQQAIASHDFDTFMKFVNKYPTYVSKDGVREIYFPEYAHVFDIETDEEIQFVICCSGCHGLRSDSIGTED